MHVTIRDQSCKACNTVIVLAFCYKRYAIAEIGIYRQPALIDSQLNLENFYI